MRTIFFLCLFFSFSCKSSKYSTVDINDKTQLVVNENPNVIDFAALKVQEIQPLEQRMKTSRGFFTPMAGSLISLATNAVKKMIAEDKKKYTATYDMALTDMVFYDQLSTESAFDPVGMQFNGFTVVRTFKSENGSIDTALTARFELDKTNPYEILNNSTFRLKLKDLQLNYAKAKIAKNGPKKLNMDFEITFKTSYVNEQGVLFDDVTLGNFYLLLREAPLEKGAAYTEYYQKLTNKSLDGRSFIVPRSFGYYIDEEGKPAKSYSQGVYSVYVKVKESSKNAFVNTLIIDNSGKIIDAAGKKLKEASEKLD